MSYPAEKLEAAASLWRSGANSWECAEAMGVTRKAFGMICSRNRDLFPLRRLAGGRPRELPAKTVKAPEAEMEKPRLVKPGTTIWTTQDGVEVTLPLVSMVAKCPRSKKAMKEAAE